MRTGFGHTKLAALVLGIPLIGISSTAISGGAESPGP
jgi:hypothetical protein